MLNRREFLRTCALLSGGYVLGACGLRSSPNTSSVSPAAGTLTEIEDAAKKEGVVVYYAVGADILNAVSKGFTASYPWANVQTFNGSLGEITSKFIAEARSGAPGADIIFMTAWLKSTYIQARAISISPLQAERQLDKDALDPQGYIHPFFKSALIMCHNTNLVQSPPADLRDLANPSWRGKIVMDHPISRGNSFTVMSSRRALWGDEEWRKWLNGLKANDILTTPTAAAAYQAVLRGERSIGLTSWVNIYTQKPGTPVAADFYQNVDSSVVYNARAAQARHPNMALLLMNWLETEAGQRMVADIGRSPLLSLDVPLAYSKFIPKNVSVLPLSKYQDVIDNPDFYTKVYSALWPT